MSGPLGTSGGGAAGVTSVTAGNGITVTGTTTPTIAASLAAGTGVSIAGTTTLTVTNTGVTSLVAGTNVSVSGATGAVTVNAPAFGTTITASTIGGTAAAGTSTSVAREDHKHAFPAGAAPASLLVASTQVTGTSASPALADHVHAMPGSAVAGASAVGDTAAAGSAGTISRSDHTHGREAFAVAGASAVGDTAATGTATTISRSDHKHGREAFGTPVVVNGQTTALATGSLTTLARADHVHTVSNVPVLLASTTLGSAAATVTLSSIPQTFRTLFLVTSARASYASIWVGSWLTFNSDVKGTGTTYWNGDNSGSGQVSSAFHLHVHGTTNYTSGFSAGRTYIFNYANTTALKTISSIGNLNNSSSGVSFSNAGPYGMAWNNTSAITSIKWNCEVGNYVAGSQFEIYGYP